jgi:TadE-like protein
LSRRRRGARGQALLETALVVPVLVTLLLGVWSGGVLISDEQTATSAARAGARLGAELGNDNAGAVPLAACQGTNRYDPCATDAKILQNILPVLETAHAGTLPAAMHDASVTEIDIYQPASCSSGASYGAGCPPDDGTYQAGEPIDRFDASGNPLPAHAGEQRYTLDLRVQLHPNEALIGVRVLYHYHSPAPFLSFDTTTSSYAVMQLAPVFV